MALVEIAPGLRLNVQEYGSGEPVILIHGGSMTHEVWDHQMAALAPEFRVIAYDFRGVGGSDRSRSGYDVDTLADDLRRLILALGLESAAVVGYALGAHVALRLVRDAPEVVSRLVLIAGAPWFVKDAGGGLPPELWRKMQRRSMTDRAAADLALIDGELFLHPPSEGMRLWLAQMAFQWPLPMFAALAPTLSAVDHDAALPDIAVPTLVIHGRHDTKTPVEGGEHLARRIPGARLVVLEDSAHAPILEDVERVNDLLLGFLR
ncbi:MAG: alpha/beta fold hydrolase [Arachnia sp.]